jgi:beta-lactamase regulating signal transducer with metallopeptidase domain
MLAPFGLWMAFVTGLLCRLAGHWRGATRLRRACTAIDEPSIKAKYVQCAAQIGLAKPPVLLRSNEVTSPMLLGILNPAVVLPANAGDLSPQALRLVLAHELAHVARRDLPLNLIASVLEAVFFFHPLVWLARRELRLNTEIAADQLALRITRSTPAEYGATLLSIAIGNSRPIRLLAVGVVTSRKTLQRRMPFG